MLRPQFLVAVPALLRELQVKWDEKMEDEIKDDEDKRNELGDRACRFLVAYDEDDEEKNPIAFINFRFTTQGEYCNCRGGDPCLFVYDIHVAKEKQRKGLGKHLMMLVCLIR